MKPALDMLLRNQNTKKSIWVAISPDPNSADKTLLLDSEKYQWDTQFSYVSGITCTELAYGDTLFHATEIKPGESAPVSIKFFSRSRRAAAAGQCSIHIGLLVARSMNGNQGGPGTAHNLVVKMDAQ